METATSFLDAAKNHPEQDLQTADIIPKNGTQPSEKLPGDVSTLTAALINDATPQVVRECISNATVLFQTTLNGEIETWQNFTAAVSGLVHRQGISVRVKFVAVKFLEEIILLLADGHGEEAAKNLGFMLELLPGKLGVIKTSVCIVIINSLVEIAKRRPEFCGRVLQVLVDLNPEVKSARGHMGSLVFAFKAAFLALLRCPHWGGLPWRDRLLAILRGMNYGEAAEQAIRRADRALREKKRQKKATLEMTWKERVKKAEVEKEKVADVVGEEETIVPALQKLTVQAEQEEREKGLSAYVDKADTCHVVHVEEQTDPRQIIGMIGRLLEQGEKGCASIEILIRKMDADLLADVVIANMSNLPSRPADVSRAVSSM